jgi:Flp pilus assembly pilin Flp
MDAPTTHDNTQPHILSASEGATAVEYAILAPVLLLLLVGIIEYNALMYASAVLEGSTAIASRQGKTGYVASGMSQQDYIYGVIQARVNGILDPTQLQITSKSYANLAVVGKPEPCISPPATPCTGTPGVNFVDINYNGVWDADQGAAGLGTSGDIVVYTVTYPWKIMTPIMLNFLGTNGTFTLTSSSIVKNEPYTVGVTR